MDRSTLSRDGRTTVLLTGFGPFPAQPANATMALVPAVARAAAKACPDVRVVPEILATEWATAPARLGELINAHAPDVALHFGVSPRARGFEIEARARNVCGDSEDAAGCRPAAAQIDPDGPDLIATNLPAAEIVTRLRRLGLDAHLSWDAGSYLCNAVLYRSLATARGHATLKRNGFIHVPADLPVPRRRTTTPRHADALSFEDAVRGGIEIVATCLARAPSIAALRGASPLRPHWALA
jgi:pyroglutamyl-peptidase